MTSASIIIPTRGGVTRLPVILAALAGQDTQDFEAIVVVDGDIDGTEHLVRSWSSRLPVRALVFGENRGRSAALNAGAEAARGRVLIRADDDLEPGPGFVSGHVARHAANAQPRGIVGLTSNVYPDTPFARAYGNAADARFLRDALAAPQERAWRLWSANVSVPRALHVRIGGYDDRYRRYGWEDVDYGYRLHLAGVPIVVAPELMARHHAASTSTAIRALRALHSGAARETFVGIHGPQAFSQAAQGRGLWDFLVAAAASVATERTVRAYGSAADAVVGRLPQAAGEKIVALAVEAAGLAGIRHPQRARSSF